VSEQPEATVGAAPEDDGPMALEDLISAIDRETEHAPGPEEAPEQESQVPGDVGAAGRRQFIRFLLGDTLLGIPLSSGLEIGHLPDITPLPNLPEWILGISNIRGEIVSMIDLKRFLGWTSHGPIRESRFIVVHHKDIKVGIVVDGIMGILSLDRVDAVIQDNPFEEGEALAFISGVVVLEEKIVHILDVEKLLSSQRMTGFRGD
jgi:purine-binding chemotaxis protein CheW